MLNTEAIIDRADEILRDQGTTIRSRQIRALAKALVEAVNRELRELDGRLFEKL